MNLRHVTYRIPVLPKLFSGGRELFCQVISYINNFIHSSHWIRKEFHVLNVCKLDRNFRLYILPIQG
jgi:hypothetical protein